MNMHVTQASVQPTKAKHKPPAIPAPVEPVRANLIVPGAHPALGAAVAAFNQVYADYLRTATAYEAAEVAAAPLRGQATEALTPAEAATLAAEEAAREADALRSGALLRAGIALVQTEAGTPAETLACVEAFVASHELVYAAERADTLAATLVGLELEDCEMQAVLEALIGGLHRPAPQASHVGRDEAFASLVRAYDGALLARKAVAEAHPVDNYTPESEDAEEAAHTRMWEAANALLAATPPDVAGLAQQLRVLVNHSDISAEAYRDPANEPGALAKIIADGKFDTGRPAALLYRHALSLACSQRPIFDDAALIDLEREFLALNYAVSTLPKDASDEVVIAAEQALDPVWEGVVDTRAHTWRGLQAKARALAALYEGKVDLWGGPPMTTDRRIVDSILRDLLGTAPFGSAPTPDEELISLGARYREVVRLEEMLDNRTPFPIPRSVSRALDDLSGHRGKVIKRTRELRAQTIAGLRVKAMIALHEGPTPDTIEYEDLDYQCARSLIADVLGLPSIDTNGLGHDAAFRALGLYAPECEGQAAARAEGVAA